MMKVSKPIPDLLPERSGVFLVASIRHPVTLIQQLTELSDATSKSFPNVRWQPLMNVYQRSKKIQLLPKPVKLRRSYQRASIRW